MRLSYFEKLKHDLKRWEAEGFVTSQNHDAILKDVEERSWGLSFSSVVSLLGVICLCFAAMTFVAANWQEISRIGRVAILLVSMWLAYGLAGLFKDHARGWYSEILVLLGCALFGASIMLISQMYHMQGAPSGAVLLWALGTTAAALLLRSVPALILAIILYAIWQFYLLDSRFLVFTKSSDVNYLYLLFLAICGFGAWWMKSRMAAHLILLSALYWIGVSLLQLTARQETPIYFMATYLICFLLMAVLFFARDQYRQQISKLFDNFDTILITYLVVISLILLWSYSTIGSVTRRSSEIDKIMESTNLSVIYVLAAVAIGFMLFAYTRKSKELYDIFFACLWLVIGAVIIIVRHIPIPFFIEAYFLVVSVWFIRMGGRQDIWQVTRIGYVSFAIVLLSIFTRFSGSLIESAGFYFIAGLVLVLGAIFGPRLMGKLFGGAAKKEESENV